MIRYYINATIFPVLYKHFLSFFRALKAVILNIPGIKFRPKGYIIDNAKLNKLSYIKINCVFLYTAQKQEIKYQKKSKSKSPIMKNKVILVLIFFLKSEAFSFIFFVSCFNDKIRLSVKDNLFNIVLIKEDTSNEYNICGI